MKVTQYITRLLEHAGIDKVEIEENDKEEFLEIQLKVAEEEVGMLIGYHGETLSAIQRLVRIVYSEEIEKRIVININDYREKRLEKLQELANNYAQKTIQTGEVQTLPYLPANERFVIHSLISSNPEFSTLETVSEGQGKQRRLTIKIK